MMSARKDAIVVFTSSSLIVALISERQSTESRQGPAAMIEACANDAMRSAMEPLRYRRSSAKPMPAMSRYRLRGRLDVMAIDRRIGVVDQVEIVITLHSLLHGEAEAPAPVLIAQQRADRGRGLLGRGDIGEDAAVTERRELVTPAEQHLATGAHIGGDRRDGGGAGLQHAERLRFAETGQDIHVDAREMPGDVDLPGEAYG